jgi:drug/metabolite transporter (DMT)-like permease
VGATPVNIIRLTCAVIFFGIFLFFKHGYILPVDFPAHAWFYLSLSGIIGFFLGDIFLFKALVEIGPRVTMLIFSLSAPVTALIGWIFLKEIYIFHQWVGMMVTLAGVSIVIFEKNQKVSTSSNLTIRNISFKGILYSIGAMLGQALGYTLSKTGMQTDSGYLDAFAATQIRAIAAFICFLVFFTVTGKWGNVNIAIRDKKAVLFVAAGSAIGPFLGVSLSLFVLHYLTTGVASTFLSLVPIFIIPFSIFLHKEHVSIRASVGAIIAVFGIYLLML